MYPYYAKHKCTNIHFTFIYIFYDISNCSFQIPHSNPQPTTIATNSYSFRTNNSLKYRFFPLRSYFFFCLNFDSKWKLYAYTSFIFIYVFHLQYMSAMSKLACNSVNWAEMKKTKHEPATMSMCINLTRDPYMNSSIY